MNPVLFTIAGDPITLAKVLSASGLMFDIVGVVLLIQNELRSRAD